MTFSVFMIALFVSMWFTVLFELVRMHGELRKSNDYLERIMFGVHGRNMWGRETLGDMLSHGLPAEETTTDG